MAFFSTQNTSIKGISSVIPKNIIENSDYDYINEQERNFLMKTTGINRKRHVDEGVTVLDLSAKAIEVLLEKINWKKE